MKQQHEREWGNTHVSLSAAAAAAAAVVWGWAAISRLLIRPAVIHTHTDTHTQLSSLQHKFPAH